MHSDSFNEPTEYGSNERVFDSTLDLVKALRSFDDRVGRGLVEYFGNRIYDFSLLLTRDHDEAAVLVADVLVEVALKKTLPQTSELKVWVYARARDHASAWLNTRPRIAPDDRVIYLNQELDIDQITDRGVLVWSALAGTSERNQMLVNLIYRHGLQGDDLAEVVGISAPSCHLLAKHSINSLTDKLVALFGLKYLQQKPFDQIPELNGLKGLAEKWDGNYTPLVHRDAAQIVADDPLMKEWILGNIGDPFEALRTIPLVPSPPGLEKNITSRIEAGSLFQKVDLSLLAENERDEVTIPPGEESSTIQEAVIEASPAPVTKNASKWNRSQIGLICFLAGNISGLLLTILWASLFFEDDIESVQPNNVEPTISAQSLPGRLTVPTGILPLESNESSSVLIANTGATSLDWAVADQPNWLSVVPEEGTLSPGTTVEIELTTENNLKEGIYSGEVLLDWTGITTGESIINVQTTVGISPDVGDLDIVREISSCTDEVVARVSVTDSSGIERVSLVAQSAEQGNMVEVELVDSGDNIYQGTVGSFNSSGLVNLTVEAEDDLGNIVRANRGSLNILNCE